MQFPDQLDVLATKFAGIVGALVSLRFIQGTWPEKMVMATGGFFISMYMSAYASMKTGIPEGACGFLLGLFGMAVCARIWETIQLMPIAETWATALNALKRKIGG